MAADFFAGEHGATLQIDLPFAHTGNTGLSLSIKKPDGSTLAWTPSTFGTTSLRYTIQSGDIPAGTRGAWLGAAIVTFPTQVRKAKFSFVVEDIP